MSAVNVGRARRREADRRAVCTQRAALAVGLCHCLPLIAALAHYAAMSEEQPYASQETLGRFMGRHRNTVGRQACALEAAGLIRVYRTVAHPGPGGRWVRRTNRYLICDRTALRQIRAGRTYAPSVVRNPQGRNQGPPESGAGPQWWTGHGLPERDEEGTRQGLGAARALLAAKRGGP